jgi:glucose-6-phosphate 1-dehydrogenase
LSAQVLKAGEARHVETVELTVTESSSAEEMDAYERLLTDAMKGDSTLFAREDSVEQAWRIVEPILGNVVPVMEYEPNTWGPKDVDRIIHIHEPWDELVVK